MSLDDLRARLDRILGSQGTPADRRAQASALHEALIDLKVAIGQNRDALATTTRELELEEQRLSDARRRGTLAEGIGDAETARVAREFGAKHEERVALLTRKISVIQDELAYAEREYAGVAAQYQAARGGGPAPVAAGPAAETVDREFDALKAKADREAAERAVQEQLEHLKRKMNRQ